MKKPLLIAILLFACVNIGILLGFFFGEKLKRITANTPPDRKAACGPLCLRIAANLYGIPCDEAHALTLCPPGAAIATDEHASYKGLNGAFIHKAVRHLAKNKQSAKKWVDGWAHTNGIESVWALLKRGIYGIFHNFSVKHMQLYVNECTFRLNEGNCKYDTVDRLKALTQGMKGKRLTYKMLTRNKYRPAHSPTP